MIITSSINFIPDFVIVSPKFFVKEFCYFLFLTISIVYVRLPCDKCHYQQLRFCRSGQYLSIIFDIGIILYIAKEIPPIIFTVLSHIYGRLHSSSVMALIPSCSLQWCWASALWSSLPWCIGKTGFVYSLKISLLRLSQFKYFLIRQKIQESDSQHAEFIFFAMNIITYNDNLTEVVIDWQ